jgi:hypothetical protein
MSAIETFRFGQIELRPAGGGVWDLRLAKEWTRADPVHCGKIDPHFWVEQVALSRDSYLVSDRSGPVLFFKTVLYSKPEESPESGAMRPGTDIDPKAIRKEMAIEIFMQFPPAGEGAEAIEMRGRIAKALEQGAPWLERVLRQKHIAEIFFETESPTLIRFCVKRLGYVQDGSKLRKRL